MPRINPAGAEAPPLNMDRLEGDPMEAAHDFLASNMELLPPVPPEVERGRRSLYPADGDLLVHELLHRGADDLPGTPPGRDDDDQAAMSIRTFRYSNGVMRA